MPFFHARMQPTNTCRGGARSQTSLCQCRNEWPLTSVLSRDGPWTRVINPFTAPGRRFRWIPSLPTSAHPSPTLSLIFLFLASGTLYIRLRPSRLRQNPLHSHTPPLALPPPSTNASLPLIPITMSIRRNNVRVSFLLNDSESSFELCVSDKISH